MKKRRFFALSLVLLVGIGLSACSSNNGKQKTSESLPSAQTILNKAEQTDFKTMTASWNQTDNNNRTLQKATAKYNKKPLVVFANFTTTSNHYKMWISGKNSYVQMQGTATNKWFKTKLTKTASYAQLTDKLAQTALMSIGSSSLKKFKVNKTSSGYSVTYKGTDKKIANNLLQNGMITSVIGIDPDELKTEKVDITINTDKKYNLTDFTTNLAYNEDSSHKNVQVKIDQINKSKPLKIPNKIVKSAVDLGSMSHQT